LYNVEKHSLNLKSVQYFLAICEEGSFTRAAIRCGVSQPSLSMAIKRLERNLGGALFHRAPHDVRLTELGRAVRPSFKAMQRCWDRAFGEVARLSYAARPTQRSGRNFQGATARSA